MAIDVCCVFFFFYFLGMCFLFTKQEDVAKPQVRIDPTVPSLRFASMFWVVERGISTFRKFFSRSLALCKYMMDQNLLLVSEIVWLHPSRGIV